MFSCREDAACRAGYLVYNSLKNFIGHIGRNGPDIKLSLSLKFPEPPLSIKFTVSLRSIESINILMACLNGLFSRKRTSPWSCLNSRGLMVKNPGGDLLLRDLSSDYHWRGSVSLPGSERDRVGPLRSGHRASGGSFSVGRGFILPARRPC